MTRHRSGEVPNRSTKSLSETEYGDRSAAMGSVSFNGGRTPTAFHIGKELCVIFSLYDD